MSTLIWIVLTHMQCVLSLYLHTYLVWAAHFCAVHWVLRSGWQTWSAGCGSMYLWPSRTPHASLGFRLSSRTLRPNTPYWPPPETWRAESGISWCLWHLVRLVMTIAWNSEFRRESKWGCCSGQEWRSGSYQWWWGYVGRGSGQWCHRCLFDIVPAGLRSRWNTNTCKLMRWIHLKIQVITKQWIITLYLFVQNLFSLLCPICLLLHSLCACTFDNQKMSNDLEIMSEVTCTVHVYNQSELAGVSAY